MKVLIAEDNALLANLYAQALRAESIDVVVACNGEEAVRLAKSVQPDLILMDVMMPRLDGLEAMRLLQTDSEKAPPVIFVSCLAHSAEMAEAHGLQAIDFLVKGRFSMSQLVSKVLNVCLRRQPLDFVYGRSFAEPALRSA